MGKVLRPGSVLALSGELGNGKTVFVQGLAQGLKINAREIRSPTFALIQEHRGKVPLCHADLYRLSSLEVKTLGLEEYWKSEAWVMAIEWAEKASSILPESALKVHFETVSEKKRKITFNGKPFWKRILAQLWAKKF